jgi:glycosyltransferase involved in cell wall biosynthesis
MLQQHGHQVTVFLQDFSIGSTMEIFEEEVRLVRFCPRNTDAHHFLGYAASLSYEFSEIVKRYTLSEGKPDVIEAQEYAGIAYYLLQFKWQNIHPFADLKVVITCHSPSFICLEYNQVPIYKFPDYWTGEMEKSCIRSADLVIFPGNYLVAELQKKLSLEGVNFTVVPNPAPDLSLIAVPGDAATDENMIVCFGKLSPLKGTFELLKYFEELWKNGSALKLYIIGGTGYFFYPERKQCTI